MYRKLISEAQKDSCSQGDCSQKWQIRPVLAPGRKGLRTCTYTAHSPSPGPRSEADSLFLSQGTCIATATKGLKEISHKAKSCPPPPQLTSTSASDELVRGTERGRCH